MLMRQNLDPRLASLIAYLGQGSLTDPHVLASVVLTIKRQKDINTFIDKIGQVDSDDSRNVNKIKKLNLSRSNFSHTQIQQLVAALNNRPAIKKLTLNSCALDDEHAKALTGLKFVERLSLKNNDIFKSAAQLLNMPNLKMLDLSGNKLSTRTSVERNKEGILKEVRLNDCNLSTQDIKNLVKYTHISKVTKLCVNQNNIDEHGCLHLAEFVNLSELDISQNRIGDGVIKFENLKKLLKLRACYCGISIKGFAALARMKLQLLDLSSNPISTIVVPGAFVDRDSSVIVNDNQLIQEKIVAVIRETNTSIDLIKFEAIFADKNNLDYLSARPNERAKLLALYEGMIDKAVASLIFNSQRIFVGLTNLEHVSEKNQPQSHRKIINYFENLSRYIENEIVSAESIDLAALVWKRWLDILFKCYDKNDLFTSAAIIATLEKNNIDRLKVTFSSLPPQTTIRYQTIAKAFPVVEAMKTIHYTVKLFNDTKLTSTAVVPHYVPFRADITRAKETIANNQMQIESLLLANQILSGEKPLDKDTATQLNEDTYETISELMSPKKSKTEKNTAEIEKKINEHLDMIRQLEEGIEEIMPHITRTVDFLKRMQRKVKEVMPPAEPPVYLNSEDLARTPELSADAADASASAKSRELEPRDNDLEPSNCIFRMIMMENKPSHFPVNVTVVNLYLENCGLTDPDAEKIAQSFKSTTSLSVAGNSLTLDGANKLLSCLGSLRVLSLKANSLFDKKRRSLSQQMLVTRQLNREYFVDLVRNHKSLADLNVQYTGIPDLDVLALIGRQEAKKLEKCNDTPSEVMYELLRAKLNPEKHNRRNSVVLSDDELERSRRNKPVTRSGTDSEIEQLRRKVAALTVQLKESERKRSELEDEVRELKGKVKTLKKNTTPDSSTSTEPQPPSLATTSNIFMTNANKPPTANAKRVSFLPPSNASNGVKLK